MPLMHRGGALDTTTSLSQPAIMQTSLQTTPQQPALPILASTLLETQPRPYGYLRTGCRVLDDEVLEGGFDRGRIVAVSGEVETEKALVGDSPVADSIWACRR